MPESPTPPPSPRRPARNRLLRAGWGVGLAGLAVAVTTACQPGQSTAGAGADRPGAGAGTATSGAALDAAAAGPTSAARPVNQDAAAGANAGASTGAGTTPTSEAAELFTACMRTHGQPHFPGITITANGSVQLDSGVGAVDLRSAAYRAALDACRHLLPKDTNPPPTPDPPPRPLPSPPATPSPTPPGPPAPSARPSPPAPWSPPPPPPSAPTSRPAPPKPTPPTAPAPRTPPTAPSAPI